jgi:hypothetical protein
MINDWIVKHKVTGQYYTVISRCSDGNTRLIGGDGVILDILEEDVKNDFEPTKVDYSKYTSAIIEQLNSNNKFKELGDLIARRLDPDYYKKGDLVYLINSSFCGKTDPGYGSYGPEFIYQIRDIHKARGQDTDFLFWVDIGRWRGKNTKEIHTEPDFCLPMYMDKFVPGDIFSTFKRYDMPY